MNRFDYLRPESVAAAVEHGNRPQAAFLAGGTNLLDLMKGGISQPTLVVDTTRIPGLSTIDHMPNGGVRIGALVRNSDLANDSAFAAKFPVVAEALLAGASAQLRNAATTAGNLMQRTRCPYFYDTASACNKRVAGAGCEAIGGATRLHAVLGWSDACIATHPSDFCVPLVALDATVEVEEASGRRLIPFDTFHLLPGKTPERETQLEAGALIVAVHLPPEAEAFAAHARYLKVRDRTSYAFAVVSATAGLRLEAGIIEEARVALGGVALKPWRAREAEKVLAGHQPSKAIFRTAAEAALADARPSGDNAFKIELARRTISRALALAAAGTPVRIPALPGSVFAEHSGASIHA